MNQHTLQQNQLLDVRKMFVAALFLGVLSVCLPQYFNAPLLAVILPLLSMILYTAFGYQQSINSSFLEQFADSVYYLGFLLTLVALVVSLYFYQGDTLEAGLLTANFSLALVTTIFGLSVRIFINNFQIDLGSIERQMMSEVELAANEMIRKAKLISMQLEVSHQETQIAIRRSIDEAAENIQQTALSIDQYADARSAEMLKNTQAIHQTIVTVVGAFEQRMRTINLPEDIFSQRLDAPLERLVRRIDETQFTLKDLNAGQADILQCTQKIVGSMTQSVAEVDILTQSIGVFNDKLYANTKVNSEFASVVKEITSLSEKTSNIAEKLDQQAEQSALAMQNFSKMVSAVNALPEDVDALSLRLKKSTEQVATTFQSIGDQADIGEKISQNLQKISEALSHTEGTVKHISDFGIHVTSTFKRLETFNQLMEKHTQLMKDMGGVAQIDIDLAKQHQQEMAGILQHSRHALAQFQQQAIGENHSQEKN